MKYALSALVFAALTVVASAADSQPQPAKPVCTAQNGPLEVIFGKCHLVKGVALYGQGLENLAGISDGMSPAISSTHPN